MGSIAKAAVLAFAGALAAAGLALAQDAPVATAPAAAPRPPAAPRPAAAATAPSNRPAVPHRAAPATARPAAPSAPGLAAYVPVLPIQPSGARLAPGEPLPPAELEAFVDGVVRDAMAESHIAGVAVSVVQNGQVALKKGYGFAGLAPARRVDPDRTLFRIGDISRTFTWITLMREVEAGRIRLEAPVNLYLPEQLQVRDQGYRTPVKVANLLDHSAGFEDRALGHLYENRYQRERPLADYLRQERPRRVHAPGEISSYSNYGAALAGEAVSYVAQKPFERLAEDEIFVPLRLAHTTFRENRPAKAGLPAPMPAALVADISDGYAWTAAGFQARPYEFIGHIAPAASASSTAGDMARYMVALLNGGALDGAAIYAPRTALAFRTPLRATPPGINGWAHGFMVYELPGGRRGFGHPGSTLSFKSNLVVIPELGLGIFVSANTETGRDLAARLPGRILEQFYAPPQAFPRPGDPALVRERGRYQGYYVSTRRAYGGLEAFVTRLRSGAWARVSSGGRLATSGREGVRTWVPEGDPAAGRFVAASGVGRLDFNLRGGRATGYVASDNFGTFERTDGWRQPRALAILAALTALAAAATLGGVLLRNRREFRETSIQGRLSQIQNTQAALWLTAIALFLLWTSKSGDAAALMYGWPGPSLILASACALVAAALTLAALVALPAVWRGGRRVDSWSPLRKLGFSFTVLVYAAFSMALYGWGALTPWSG
ncbi:serine hydrolase domain-containing protein [Phenylobacterium sp.]|jgi:CubicO group peptidase (beta-lactamase class C family)|uniref:serine hydrolase domain-containing protein n=1 Tax=Phenylobacterium sp. TaxID=1871053 RepID=UPI002F4266D9